MTFFFGFGHQASGPSYQRVDLEVRCSTKREAHIEKMRRQWIQHQDDKADGQMKWEDLQTHNDDYADEYEDDDNSRMTVSHGTEHTETAWSSWEKKEEKEVVKQIDHGVVSTLNPFSAPLNPKPQPTIATH